MIQAVKPSEASVARTGPGQTHINTLVLSALRVRLFDPFENPMPQCPFRLTLGERAIEGKSDENAWIEIRAGDVPDTAKIAWGKAEPAEEEIPQGPGYPEASEEASPPETTAQPAPAPKPTAVPPPPAESDSITYLYEREIHLAFDADEEKAACQRLHNLGYNVWQDLEETVRAFQLTYQRQLTGKLSDIKSDLWCWHDDCGPQPFPQLEPKQNVK